MVTDKTSIMKAGDIVKLSIGGPNMLIEIIDKDNVAHCVWFNRTNELQKDSFEVYFLEIVENEQNSDESF